MKNAFAVLTALLTFSLIGASAAAAGPSRATTSADGGVTIASPSTTRLVVQKPPAKAESLKEIYSTFNSDRDNLYNCCIAYTLSTPDSVVGARWSTAMPFTPAESGSVRKIVLAFSYVAGINSVNVSLRTDTGGLPGDVIRRFQVTDLPDSGGCCETETVAAKGIPVVAGVQYWVVARVTADTWAGWNLNSISATGPFARNQGHGWYLRSDDTLAAFKVLGD